MKVFISWSGERSKVIAQALDWLVPRVINTAKSWISSEGIEPGARWSIDIAKQLEETDFGIICLTQDNLDSQWIHFEAGALSKFIDKSYVVPYLYENKATDIVGPLAQFQSKQVNRNDTLQILKQIHKISQEKSELDTSSSIIEETFEKYWKDFDAKIKLANEIEAPILRTRSVDEMFEEIIGLLRENTLQKSFHLEQLSGKSEEHRVSGNLLIESMYRDYERLHGIEHNKLQPYDYAIEKWFKNMPISVSIKDIQIEINRCFRYINEYEAYLNRSN